MVEFDRRTVGDGTAEVVAADDVSIDVETDVLVAGAGGAGLTAAAAACERPELTVTVLEKDSEPGGNTALSTGMIPAAGTKLQEEAGIHDTPEDMARDILEKNDFQADERIVRRLANESANLVQWLIEEWEVPLHLVTGFKYPKHSEFRMHAPDGRNGASLIAELETRLRARDNVELLTDTPVVELVADDGAVVGAIAGERRREAIGAETVVLATDGFGGNARMIEDYCEADVEEALYFGADGNTGDGIRMGAELGGELACMDAYQAHATVAHQTGVLSTYAVIMNGGLLVNERGERFGDESAGYSAFAIDVLRQPGGIAYEIFDRGVYEKLKGEFDDFDEMVELDGYTEAETVPELAEALGCDPTETLTAVDAYNDATRAGEPDEAGRTEGRNALESPFYGTKVTGGLIHTQGGLVVDEHARVQRSDGSIVQNLYAAGGAAVGVSGHGAGGYLSGNGLTAALGLGRLAGIHARDSIRS